MTATRERARLHWRLHDIPAGIPRHLELPSGEGIFQVLLGSCSMFTGGGPKALNEENILWHRGGGSVELLATEDCTVLQTWALLDPGAALLDVVHWDDLSSERLNASLTGRSVGGEGIAAWRFEVADAYVVDDLRHEEEQISCAFAGRFLMTVNGEQIEMDPRVITHVPTWIPHGGVFNAGSVELLEIFSPPRLTTLTHRVGAVH